MRKFSLILAVLCLGITMTVSSAMAFTLAGGYTGPVKFEFGSFDAGTTGYPAPGPGVVIADYPAAPDGVLPAGIAGADATAAFPAPGGNPTAPYVGGTAPTGNVYAGGTAIEDSWAIFDVSVIRRPDTLATLWTRGTGGEYLTGYFHGEVDHYVKELGIDPITSFPVYEIRGIGGKIEMFLDTTDDFAGGAGPGARYGFDVYGGPGTYGYPGAAADDGSEGTLFLSTVLAPGVMAGDLTSTFFNTFNFAAATGSGKMFLDITGGAYKDLFNWNTEFDPNGSAHDFFLSFTADPGVSGWTVTNTGHALGTATPEPTTMLLFGMGMLGLATRIRRKKAA